MKELVEFLDDAAAAAFVLLGVIVAVGWVRRRENSLGWLALAIVTLALVSGLGRLGSLINFTPLLLSQLVLAAFMVSAYAVLRLRGSLIPLQRRWHVAAIASMVAASA